MLKPTNWKWTLLLIPCAFFAATAHADATSHLPEQFQSRVYVEADYENFCTSQSSSRECVEVTIKNQSQSVIDINTGDPGGSLTGSGSILGFQVFEAPGCLARDQLDSNVSQHVSSEEGFSRRMRQESLHYWRNGVSKKIKVLHGCAYAVAIKRRRGNHNWHFAYVPPTVETGCEISYRYITKKADLKSYEKWATFGAIGGGAESLLTGLTTAGISAYYIANVEDIAVAEIAMEAGAVGSVPAVIVLGATAAYEAGLWGAYGIDTTIHLIDGKRDFLLGKNC